MARADPPPIGPASVPSATFADPAGAHARDLRVAYGALAGLLLPRAAYKLAVPAGETWRAYCPAGHPAQAWLGLPHCKNCATENQTAPRARRWYGPSAPVVAR